MRLTQFSTKFNDIKIKGEYEGNEKSGKAVIFSHGFGVGRDSRGIFQELGDKLKDNFLVIRFDYNNITFQGDKLTVYPCSSQAKILNKVLEHARETFEIDELSIIAHSLGCVIVGILNPQNINKIILNAPPIISPYKEIIRNFSGRMGVHVDLQGRSEITRSDGSITYIDREFWQDVNSVDPIELYKKLKPENLLGLIIAKNDDNLEGDTALLKKIEHAKYLEIDGDHDFSGIVRKKWLELNVQLVNR